MDIHRLIALIQESTCAVKIKPKGRRKPQEWSWVIEPVPNYIESGSGPWRFREVEYVEINPIKLERIGRLVAPKKSNKTASLEAALHEAGIPYVLLNNIFRVYFPA